MMFCKAAKCDNTPISSRGHFCSTECQIAHAIVNRSTVNYRDKRMRQYDLDRLFCRIFEIAFPQDYDDYKRRKCFLGDLEALLKRYGIPRP